VAGLRPRGGGRDRRVLRAPARQAVLPALLRPRDGSVLFTTIFPAAYAGRWPHIHFEVYPSLDAATTASGKLRTSQLALPEDACKQVYASEGYGQSLQNLAQTSLDTDMVFSDGYSLQLAKVTGNVTDGMTATLNVPV
jgi:protocatechuate 3,4-dioxygenase beta subunit